MIIEDKAVYTPNDNKAVYTPNDNKAVYTPNDKSIFQWFFFISGMILGRI